ncbi:MAG: CbiQ family ECF transporter T component [Propionibacteriaceae bacterium]|nr:CbiQ family ECF transporter T component [Propionibacteriaceae bacterium]
MNAHANVLGFHEPGDGWLFRWPVGAKYLLMLAIVIPALAMVQWQVSLGALVCTMVFLVTSGISVARSLRLGWMMWSLLAVLALFHLATLAPVSAFVRPGNLLVAVLCARMLTLTTPTPELMDALVSVLAPLRPLGVNPDQVALAVALMIRSIPYLLGTVDDARAAARARGLERNPALLLTPVIIGAVAYAERSGEALAARGIGERPLAD